MTRVESLKKYLIQVLEEMQHEFKVLNINFLSSEVDNYSLDKIPAQSTIETYITGKSLNKDVFNLRNRNTYSSNIAENLNNLGFWEAFENKIYSNNKKGVLPDIQGIQKIVCLNSGSLQSADTQTCEMSIQIQIEYEMEE